MISDNEVKRSVIVIRNAIAKEMNGKYHFSQFRNEAGEFTRRGIVNGKEYLFTIFKYGISSGYIALSFVGQEVDFTPDVYEFKYYNVFASNYKLLPTSFSHMYNKADPGLTLEVHQRRGVRSSRLPKSRQFHGFLFG
jgi:hypothetical protein